MNYNLFWIETSIVILGGTMKRLILLPVILFLMPLSNVNPLSDVNPQDIKSPCDDILYLQLKLVPLDEMSERQYEYFISKTKECDEYQKQLLEEQAEKEKAEASQKTAESMRKYLGFSRILLLILAIASLLPLLLLFSL